MKLWAAVATIAVSVLMSGCGGGGNSSVTPPPQGEPDPVAYQIIGIDMVPDQIAGQPDIRLNVDPLSPNGSGVIALRLYSSCGAPGNMQ